MNKIKLMYKDIYFADYFYDKLYYFEPTKNFEQLKINYTAFCEINGISEIKPKSSQILDCLNEIVKDIKQRPDLINLLHLTSKESDFEILYRYSKFPQNKFAFWICS